MFDKVTALLLLAYGIQRQWQVVDEKSRKGEIRLEDVVRIALMGLNLTRTIDFLRGSRERYRRDHFDLDFTLEDVAIAASSVNELARELADIINQNDLECPLE